MPGTLLALKVAVAVLWAFNQTELAHHLLKHQSSPSRSKVNSLAFEMISGEKDGGFGKEEE